MPIPVEFTERLSIPLIASPMFIASGINLVVECCKAGIVGTFPALNQRTSDGFESWLIEINAKLAKWEQQSGKKAAPFVEQPV
jgi:nitronate monooxygenase